MSDRLPETGRRARFREAEEGKGDRGPKVDRPDGKASVLVGLQMNPGWESQLGPGYRQAKVALVLVIETRSRLLDVAAGVLVEVEVMPHHVRRRHAPATDHEHDRQREGPESDGQLVDHERDRKCPAW